MQQNIKSMRRMIPRITTASLIFAGVGCDNDRTTANDVAEAYCRAEAYCNPDSFAYDYASESQCRAGFAAEIDDYFSQGNQSFKCEDAFLEYYVCYNTEYYNSGCNGGAASEKCDRQYYRMMYFCDFDDYEYY